MGIFGNSTNLGIEDLSIGISSKGLDSYLDTIKAEYLEKVSIDTEVDAIIQVINTGWQGKSRDTFEKQLNQMADDIKADLKKEYKDLENRFKELEAFYFEQDNTLMNEE